MIVSLPIIAIPLIVLVVIYLVWEIATGDVEEDEDQHWPEVYP